MASVIVTWGGTCHDPELRLGLVGQLGKVARLSHSCFAEPTPILDFDGPIRGRVVLDARLFDAPPPGEHFIPLDNPPTPAAHIAIRNAWPADPPPPPVPELYEVVGEGVYLRGIEFRLFDPRGFYPTEDRVSFVFATLTGSEVLRDRVVAVHDRAICETIEDDAMRDVDWLLTRPSIHLRYYCENWIDLLLGTVKCCFMPKLWWWRNGYQPGYGDLSRALSRERRETFRGDETLAAEAAFVAVEDSLRAELASWGATSRT